VSQRWGSPAGATLPPPPQYRPSGPPWGAIAAGIIGVVLLVAAVVGVVLYVGSNADDDADDDRAAQADLVIAPRDAAFALDDERTVATVTALGMGDVVDPPIEDNGAARRQTDAAIRDFEAAVADSDDPGAEAYRDALDAFAGLDTLRSDVDSTEGQRGEMSSTRPIRDRYGEIIAALLQANTRFVDTIDDPELRAGARLYEVGLRQIELVRGLGTEVPDIAGWTTPEGITRMSNVHGQLLQGRAFVMELATGEHADTARQLDAELEAAGHEELVEQVLETGRAPFGPLVQSVGDALTAWHTFLREVEATLARPR
jgi:nitrate/nitrite sensing protein